MASANLTERLSELKGASGTARLEAGGWSLELRGFEGDAFSCRLESLSLRPGAREGNLTAAQVETWAHGVAGRVTGLLEPLRVVEVDRTEAVAMLRSDRPMRRDGELAYYELLLRPERTAELHRYRAFAGEAKPRESIPFGMTHEVLAKFVGDVAG